MAARYYEEVGRPFQGEFSVKVRRCTLLRVLNSQSIWFNHAQTCQKPRALGKGMEWEAGMRPTPNPYRREHKWAHKTQKGADKT